MLTYVRTGICRARLTILNFGSLACCVACALPAHCADQANDLLPAAWQAYRLGDFDHAEQLFERVEAKSLPSQAVYVESLLGQASIWNTRQDGRDPARATALYAKIEQIDPLGPLTSWAMLDKVRVSHLERADQPLDYTSLARAYRAVWVKFPDTPAGQEGLMQALILEEVDADSTKQNSLLAEYQDFLAKHPGSVFREHIYGSMASLYDKLGQPQQKLSCLLSSLQYRELDKGNPNELLVWNYWSIAVAAEFDAGDFGVARTFYQKIINQYPSDLLVFRCQQALKRMNRLEADLRAGRKIDDNLLQPTPFSGEKR